MATKLSPDDYGLDPHRPAVRWTRPLREFMETSVSGGIVLLVAAAMAMILANSSLSGAYFALLDTKFAVSLGSYEVNHSLREWVNEGLMAIFFFVIGLEVKRELVVGELSDRSRVTLPAMAALGGMVVPALFYFVLNPSGEAARGWGVPMATDIAFALGVLALLGARAPLELRVLLLTVAIVDDIGAVLIIAFFYTGDLEMSALLIAGIALLMVRVLQALRIWWTPLYVITGTIAWYFMTESGVHATIAGVILGLMAPARPIVGVDRLHTFTDRLMQAGRSHDPLLERLPPDPAYIRQAQVAAANVVAVTDRQLHALHPWASFVILPIFALSNAGVTLDPETAPELVQSTVTWGIISGLVIGKIVGVAGFAALAVKLGAPLPKGVNSLHIIGMAALCGIGFTMSLFIADLAFSGGDLLPEAVLGILMASTIAAIIGGAILTWAGPGNGRRPRVVVAAGEGEDVDVIAEELDAPDR